MERAREASGSLVYRNEDLDPHRCRPEYTRAAIEDLKWFGCSWDEGPDLGGPNAPYSQSERTKRFLDAWKKLKNLGYIYPCDKSRKDVAQASLAPHMEDTANEPVYPETWRPPQGTGCEAIKPGSTNWRFRVPAAREIIFDDGRLGPCAFTGMQDFGDFLIWRKDGVPAYELAVVVDDHDMQITEVVRGEDLLISTARQLLLYEALVASHQNSTILHCSATPMDNDWPNATDPYPCGNSAKTVTLRKNSVKTKTGGPG